MIHYAQNRHNPRLHAQLQQWLATPLINPASAKWFLLDAAMLTEPAFAALEEHLTGGTLKNIFDNSRYEVYGTVAPHLIRLDTLLPEEQTLVLNTVYQLSDGLPMLSALDAIADVTILCANLLWLAQASSADGMQLYCRFADTRITPSLFDTLDKAQCRQVGHCVHNWQIVNRFGMLKNVLTADVVEPPKAVSMASPLILTDQQFVRLMQAAEMDEVFQMLCGSLPSAVPDADRGYFYSRLEEIIENARIRGLKDTCDILQFSVIALTTHDHFDNHPLLQDTWTQILANTAKFANLVDGWQDDVWFALANTHPTTWHNR